jgi:RNA polymerase sigma-70 factor (ECF subfamily)
MSELKLLVKIKNDPKAFSELFRMHYKPIFGYLFRRIRDVDATMDIASEVFFKAFVHIQKFEYRGISIKAWLYRIATNEANLYFRNQRKRTGFLERLSFEDHEQFRAYVLSDKESLEKELERNDQFLKVSIALMTLPIKYQEVIALRYFEGKDNTEISEILGIKEGTVKSLVSRGLTKLRQACNQK